MITETGVLAAGFSSEGANSPPSRYSNSAEIASLSSYLPRWDRKLRQLLYDGCLVKQFRLPAGNQEAVLAAFEQEGWPPSIDDPLPFLTRQRSKRRLHETIRHLNANHQDRLIRLPTSTLWGRQASGPAAIT